MLYFLFSTNIVLIFFIYKIRHRNKKNSILNSIMNGQFLLPFTFFPYISFSSLLPSSSLHLLPSFSFPYFTQSALQQRFLSTLMKNYVAKIYARKCIIKYLLVTDIKGLLILLKSCPLCNVIFTTVIFYSECVLLTCPKSTLLFFMVTALNLCLETFLSSTF